MRDDLTKVLCEQERPRSWDHYSNYRHLREFERQYDDAYDEGDDELFAGVGSGYRESMKYRYGYNAKSFGEHLSPLYGLLNKNVGRRWDRVYSELCKSFDRRSATGNHIFQHLYDELAEPTKTFIGEDGKVWIRGRYSHNAERARDSSYRYYVDPRDGILKRNTAWRSYRDAYRRQEAERIREELKVKRVIDASTELHNIDGVWFEVKFTTFAGARTQVPYRDPHDNTVLYRTEIAYPYTYDVLKKIVVSSDRVAVSKRTLSHKDLKKFGLLV